MSTFEKKLEEWTRVKDDIWSSVESVLKRSGFIQAGSRCNGSHYTYIHPKLEDLLKGIPKDSFITKRYAPNGQIIVIVHNNRVYQPVLKVILQALDDIRMYEEYMESKQ